jgi:hypothetical protein
MNSKENKDRSMAREHNLYQITLQVEADEVRTGWFKKMGFDISLTRSDGELITILTGQIIDQSHLRGLLNTLWDLNFEVIQVKRL